MIRFRPRDHHPFNYITTNLIQLDIDNNNNNGFQIIVEYLKNILWIEIVDASK